MGRRRKETIDDIGGFNILLVGKNPHSISIADNIKDSFFSNNVLLDLTTCSFNIVEDIEFDCKSQSWFNEFIYDLTTIVKFNNIVISSEFHNWMKIARPIEKIYMKKLLQAMNFVIIDVSGEEDGDVFDSDIPQISFNTSIGFLNDVYLWIDEMIGKMNRRESFVKLIKSICGTSIPYLGNVFGCFSDNISKRIVHADGMRFDVPILFDEFCKLTKGMSIEEIDDCIFTRSNSALSVFFK